MGRHFQTERCSSRPFMSSTQTHKYTVDSLQGLKLWSGALILCVCLWKSVKDKKDGGMRRGVAFETLGLSSSQSLLSPGLGLWDLCLQTPQGVDSQSLPWVEETLSGRNCEFLLQDLDLIWKRQPVIASADGGSAKMSFSSFQLIIIVIVTCLYFNHKKKKNCQMFLY